MAASPASDTRVVPSLAPRVLHRIEGVDPQEWALLGSDGLAVAERRSLIGLVTVGAAKAKAVAMGSLSWTAQALGLLEDVGSSLARAYENTTLAVLGPEQTATEKFEQWPWSEGTAYAWGVGEFSGGELEVGGLGPVPTVRAGRCV